MKENFNIESLLAEINTEIEKLKKEIEEIEKQEIAKGMIIKTAIELPDVITKDKGNGSGTIERTSYDIEYDILTEEVKILSGKKKIIDFYQDGYSQSLKSVEDINGFTAQIDELDNKLSKAIKNKTKLKIRQETEMQTSKYQNQVYKMESVMSILEETNIGINLGNDVIVFNKKLEGQAIFIYRNQKDQSIIEVKNYPLIIDKKIAEKISVVQNNIKEEFYSKLFQKEIKTDYDGMPYSTYNLNDQYKELLQMDAQELKKLVDPFTEQAELKNQLENNEKRILNEKLKRKDKKQLKIENMLLESKINNIETSKKIKGLDLEELRTLMEFEMKYEAMIKDKSLNNEDANLAKKEEELTAAEIEAVEISKLEADLTKKGNTGATKEE